MKFKENWQSGEHEKFQQYVAKKYQILRKEPDHFLSLNFPVSSIREESVFEYYYLD